MRFKKFPRTILLLTILITLTFTTIGIKTLTFEIQNEIIVKDYLLDLKEKQEYLGIEIDIDKKTIKYPESPEKTSFKTLFVKSWDNEKTVFISEEGFEIVAGVGHENNEEKATVQQSINMGTSDLLSLPRFSLNSGIPTYLPNEYWSTRLHVKEGGSPEYDVRYSRNHNIADNGLYDFSPNAPSYNKPGQYNLWHTVYPNPNSWPNWNSHHLPTSHISWLAGVSVLWDAVWVSITFAIGAVYGGPPSWLAGAVALIVGIIVSTLAFAPWMYWDMLYTEIGDGWEWSRFHDYWHCGWWCTHWGDYYHAFGGGLLQGGLYGRDSFMYVHLPI